MKYLITTKTNSGTVHTSEGTSKLDAFLSMYKELGADLTEDLEMHDFAAAETYMEELFFIEEIE